MAEKIVVLGTAHPHVYALVEQARAMSGVEVVGVYDNDAARLQSASERMKLPVMRSLEEALEKRPVLALVGAVPSDRASFSQAAVASGASVLVDKPLALSHEALDTLIDATKVSGRQVMVYYPYRGYPQLLAAKAALDAGRIGKLVRVMAHGPHKLNPASRPGWHWTRAHNGGILIDIGSHHADLCCWIAGASPHWLCAQHVNFTQPSHIEFQDFGAMQMRFPNGAFGSVEVDWLNVPSTKTFGDTRVWILGTEGKIEVRLGDETSASIWTIDKANQPLDLTPYKDRNWDQKLIEDLLANRPTDIPQEDIWRTSRTTLYAFESASDGGKPLDLPAF